MKALVLAWRTLHRDWRAGELRVLSLALVIAVGSVTSVGVFADRVNRAMLHQAGELLAADLAVISTSPLPETWAVQARRQGLEVAQGLSFVSVVMAGLKTQLAAVKAVDPGYPLRGTLRVAKTPFGPDWATQAIPAPGTVWLDPRLTQILGIELGEPIALGAREFRVTQVLAYEPDRGSELFSIAPRLLMNRVDIPATGLVLPGSRVTYRHWVSGPQAALRDYRRWVTPRLREGQQVQGVQEARPRFRTALERAQRFLGLAALVSVMLSGIAVATAAWRFAARHMDSSAILRCLGAPQALVGQTFGLELLMLGLLASTLGAAVGYAAQGMLALILGQLVAGELPMPTLLPAIHGLLIGLVTLLGFALPPILALRHVPPSRVLRRDIGAAPLRTGWVYGLAVSALIGLMLWQVRDPKLIMYVLGSVGLTVLALGATAYGLVRLMLRLRRHVGVAWRFGLANIGRRAQGSVVQVVALGLGFMALLTLTLVRSDLLTAWKNDLPPQTPNHFVINIQPDEVSAMRAFLHQRGITEAELLPMVRARLVAIDGRAVSADHYTEPRARRLVQREFNLSWASRLQEDNRVISGKWWPPSPTRQQAQFSVEEGLAQTLGIALGDQLRFRIAGQAVTGQVTSLRTVQWDSFRVNFFVITPPGLLEGYPATYITSFYLPAQRPGLLAELVKRFPSITIIDVDALLSQVHQIIDRAVLAVEYVFLFTILAGLVVLLAAIQASQDERLYESAVLRTLGASRRTLLKSLWAEFALLGLLAGALAALAASGLGWGLAELIFDIPYRLNPWVWGIGLLGGTLGVGLVGTLGTLPVLRRPPLYSLRQG